MNGYAGLSQLKKQKPEAAGSTGAVQALGMENDVPVVGPDAPTADSSLNQKSKTHHGDTEAPRNTEETKTKAHRRGRKGTQSGAEADLIWYKAMKNLRKRHFFEATGTANCFRFQVYGHFRRTH
jgi:hypothetical protein